MFKRAEPTPVPVMPEPIDGMTALYATVACIGVCMLLRAWPKGAPDSVALFLFFAFW